MYHVQTHAGRFLPNSFTSKPSTWRTKRSAITLAKALRHYHRLTQKRTVGGVRIIQNGVVVDPYLYVSPDCTFLMARDKGGVALTYLAEATDRLKIALGMDTPTTQEGAGN